MDRSSRRMSNRTAWSASTSTRSITCSTRSPRRSHTLQRSSRTVTGLCRHRVGYDTGPRPRRTGPSIVPDPDAAGELKVDDVLRRHREDECHRPETCHERHGLETGVSCAPVAVGRTSASYTFRLIGGG